jgi:transcription-repair coupling factor (superfamily II helicase)
MHERELEQIMVDFIDGRYDILVSTTIVESGIDIPNVNTILIMDADRFGLSQLYQLRGRVGRTNRLAFAYLLYKKNKEISEIAEKRLRTIREFTEFGAGFKISMRDLEIRGAGNLLGAEQHGHMAAVGYELYCKMVEEAVSALSGLAVLEQAEDIQIDLPWPAFIPDDYILDEASKLDAYREIADALTEAGSVAVVAGLEDRYGPAPDAVRNLAAATLVRRLCSRAGIKRIRGDAGALLLEYRAASSVRHEGLAEAAARFGRRLGIDGTKVLSLRLQGADTSELTALLRMLSGQ